MTEKKPNWLERLRRFVINALSILAEGDAPAGGIQPGRHLGIDDGVDYSLPLVVPTWMGTEQREKFIQAYVKEASTNFHFQFDRPYLYNENLSQFPAANPLMEWDFRTRRDILARCHLAWERNPLAKTAIKLTTFFAVGKGMQISYRNKEVEAVVEAFRKDKENGVDEYEKSFCSDLQLDGELFIRFFKNEERTVIAPIPPWEIEYIKTERGFNKRTIEYKQQGTQSDGTPGDAQQVDDPIPAKEMLHFTINKCSYEKRGRPDLFPILPWLKAYKDWLENRARQNHWRGSLLWWVKLLGATPQQVGTKRAQYKQPPPPGSLIVSNEKEEWSAIDNKVGAADVAEDGRQIKLMTAVGEQLPEYMLSDGQNANLASATAQQLPALRKFSDMQDIMVALWIAIYTRVIENAIEAGVLEEEVEEQDADGEPIREEPEPDETAPVPPVAPAAPAQADQAAAPVQVAAPPTKRGKAKMIKAVDAFDVTAPELEKDDPKSLAEALQIAVTRSWASNETAATQMGYDYRVEQKKIKREMVADRDLQAQGLMPGPMNPFMAPPDFSTKDEGADDGNKEPAAKQ